MMITAQMTRASVMKGLIPRTMHILRPLKKHFFAIASHITQLGSLASYFNLSSMITEFLRSQSGFASKKMLDAMPNLFALMLNGFRRLFGQLFGFLCRVDDSFV